MLSLASFEKFPEVFTGGKAPAVSGVRDLEKKAGTPLYMYGWVVSRAELHEALNGKPAGRDVYLSQIYIGVEGLLYTRWKEKGYDLDFAPLVREYTSKYVLIFFACNDSDAIIKSVMENTKLHEECRACMCYPKMMALEPAWIRYGMRHLPKELSDPVNGDIQVED